MAWQENLLKLPGIDYMAVSKKKDARMKRLVEEHERTRSERSKKRIVDEFPPISING